MRCRLHVSAVEEVSSKISELVKTEFSLMISEPTGAVCAVDSTCQLWKQFPPRYLSRQRLSFR